MKGTYCPSAVVQYHGFLGKVSTYIKISSLWLSYEFYFRIWSFIIFLPGLLATGNPAASHWSGCDLSCPAFGAHTLKMVILILRVRGHTLISCRISEKRPFPTKTWLVWIPPDLSAPRWMDTSRSYHADNDGNIPLRQVLSSRDR
jgi:hypothetical protein